MVSVEVDIWLYGFPGQHGPTCDATSAMLLACVPAFGRCATRQVVLRAATGAASGRARTSDTKRRSTTAGPFGVRVVEHKALAHETSVVVERGSVDVLEALGIDKHFRTVWSLEDVIGRLRGGLPGKHVAQP